MRGPKTTQNTMPLSQTEAVCRQLFATVLPFLRPQYNVRPAWLTNPKTGRRLEIDILYEQIRVGIEADGIQHKRPIISLQKDHAAFMDQLARDAHKAEVCRQRGITIIPLTIFDLTAQRFPATMRRVFHAAEGAMRNNPILAAKIGQARVSFERGYNHTALRPLFDEAERLSRQRFKPPRPKRVGWWQRLCVLVRGG